MIDSYRVWKDDKESEPKVKSKKKGFTCILCSKKVNGLPRHMDDVHGKGTWKKYLSAMEAIEKERTDKIIKLMGF